MQEAKEEGIRQGIWLCIQRLVHMEQYHCIDVDRKDDIDVIYKKVKRS